MRTDSRRKYRTTPTLFSVCAVALCVCGFVAPCSARNCCRVLHGGFWPDL